MEEKPCNVPKKRMRVKMRKISNIYKHYRKRVKEKKIKKWINEIYLMVLEVSLMLIDA